MTAPEQCDAGCILFDGGERKHTKTCPFYPESRTKMYDDALDRIAELEAAILYTTSVCGDIISNERPSFEDLSEAHPILREIHEAVLAKGDG